MIIRITVLTLSLFAIGSALGYTTAGGLDEVLGDFYSRTGSRWTALVSNAGVLAWMGSATVCLFTAWVLASGGWRPRVWSRFFSWLGLLTLALLVDDYLAIHEAADDVVALLTGDQPDRAVKNAFELIVLGAYGVAFVVFLTQFRLLIARTEYTLLLLAGVMLGTSLVMDMLPVSILVGRLGVPQGFLLVTDEGFKALGIATYGLYVVRTAGHALSSSRHRRRGTVA